MSRERAHVERMPRPVLDIAIDAFHPAWQRRRPLFASEVFRILQTDHLLEQECAVDAVLRCDKQQTVAFVRNDAGLARECREVDHAHHAAAKRENSCEPRLGKRHMKQRRGGR